MGSVYSQIEDTDRQRSSLESEQAIFDALRWTISNGMKDGLWRDYGPTARANGSIFMSRKLTAYLSRVMLIAVSFPRKAERIKGKPDGEQRDSPV